MRSYVDLLGHFYLEDTMKTATESDFIFETAFEKTIGHEGGYVNDPADPGGETKFGISKRSYSGLDIANLTLERAKEIYKRDFWDHPGFSGIRDAELAIKLFDLGVNFGTGRVIKFLQEATNLFETGLKVDGDLGPKTLKCINGFRYPKALISGLEIIAGNYYISLGRQRFLAGWLIRLDD